MVHNTPTVEHREPIAYSSNTGPAFTGPVSTPSGRKTTPDSLEVERNRLLEQGCSRDGIYFATSQEEYYKQYLLESVAKIDLICSTAMLESIVS